MHVVIKENLNLLANIFKFINIRYKVLLFNLFKSILRSKLANVNLKNI